MLRIVNSKNRNSKIQEAWSCWIVLTRIQGVISEENASTDEEKESRLCQREDFDGCYGSRRSFCESVHN